jgi:hypothetical protein
MTRSVLILTWMILPGLVFGGCVSNGKSVRSDPVKTWISGAPEELNFQEWERILERLEELHNRPVSLESISPAQLRDLPFVSDRTARAILTYRNANGKIESVDILADSLVMTDTEKEVLKWITVPEKRESSAPRGNMELSVTGRLERTWNSSIGMTPGSGSPVKSIWKLKARGAGIAFSTTLAKDAFEPLRWDPGKQWYAYDHLVTSLEWVGKDGRTRVTAGNFLVETGQGLLFSQPFASRLSTTEPARTVKSRTRVRPFSSTLSTANFRGVAVDQKLGESGRILLFGSSKQLDARLHGGASASKYGSASDSSFFTLVTSGLHRTESQQQTRNAISAKTFGIVAEHRSVQAGVGAAYMMQSFSGQVLLPGAGSAITSGSAGSLWGFYKSRFLSGGAEISVASDAGIRWIAGAILRSVRRFELGIHIRGYAKSNFSLYASAPGLRPSLGDQTGVFVLGKFRITPGLTAHISHDMSEGYISNRNLSWKVLRRDARLQLAFRRKGPLRLDIQFRRLTDPELSSRLLPTGSVQAMLISRSIQTMKGVLRMAPTNESQISAAFIRTRSGTRVGRESTGNLFYLEMMSPVFKNVKVRIRQTLFDVPVSALRIYAFEWDVRGKLTVPVFSGTGERSSIYIHGQITSKWNVEINYVRLRRITVSEIAEYKPEFDRKYSITVQIRKIL